MKLTTEENDMKQIDAYKSEDNKKYQSAVNNFRFLKSH